MELRQLEHFVALAEEGSFTRAAKRMNIVQSGLSMSIRALEDELGTKLFTRDAKGVALTSAGESMLADARRAVEAVGAAREAVAATQGLKRGQLTLGIAQYSHGDTLPQLLSRFHTEYPAVSVQAIQGKPLGLLADVEAGRLDIAMCGRPATLASSLTAVRLARAPYVLACATNHRLASKKDVTLESVAEEPFLELHAGWVTRQITDEAFASADIDRNIVCEVDDVYLRLRMVEAGLGVAILPCVTVPGVKVAYVSLKAALPEWEMVMAFKGAEPANAAAQAFLAMAKQEWSLS